MIRTYVFGCHEQISGLRTFSVNVNLTGPDVSEAQKLAVKTANEVAVEKKLPNPTLLFESGIPEFTVVLEKGQVAAVFCRNADLLPVVSVYDLDYENDPDAARQEFEIGMHKQGYQRIPHMIE